MDNPQHPHDPVDDDAIEEDLFDDPGAGRTVGIAFVLGVIVGVAASSLIAMSREDEPGTRRLLRRAAPAEPKPLSGVLRDEAALVATSVLRELGGAATRWILDAAAAPADNSDRRQSGDDGGRT